MTATRKGVKPCVRPEATASLRGVALTATCAAAAAVPRPAGVGGLSRPPGHDHRAVRAGRPDRHHRAHPGQCRCRSGSASSSWSTTAPAPPATPAWGRSARATPDGYTLLVTSTAIAVNSALFKKLPYDPFKDFAPISELVNAPNVLVVRANSDIKTIADLVAHAKANPTKFNYSSPAPAPSRISPASCSSCAPISTWCTCRIRGAGPAAQAVLERHRPGRLGRAGRRRVADPGRAAARARGHQREALVLAAERADHDRGRLSRISSPTRSTRSSRRRACRSRSSRCW